jgi:hypothetical protein
LWGLRRDERVGLAWVKRLLEKHKEIMLPSRKNSRPRVAALSES